MTDLKTKFKKRLSDKYHAVEIEALWNECKDIFNIVDNEAKGKFVTIPGSRKLHADRPSAGRFRFCAGKLCKEFDIDPKKLEYYIAYNSSNKTIRLRCVEGNF